MDTNSHTSIWNFKPNLSGSSDFFLLTNGIHIPLVTLSEEATTISYFLLTYHPSESLVRSVLTLKLSLHIFTANSMNKLN